MIVLRDGIDPDRFFDRLENATQRLLILDYDGTLAPFQVDRKTAFPYPGVRDIIDSLMAGGHTRVVLVSGRWTRDLLPLLGFKVQPEIFGSHGWERLLPDGRKEDATPDPDMIHALVSAGDWIREKGWDAFWEEKPAMGALHLRGLEHGQTESVLAQVIASWDPLCRDTGLELHEFDGGLELRIPGRSKGTVVRTLLDEIDSETVVAYLGDDRTDEDAFRVLRGRGLNVLVRPEFRETLADTWIQPPGELLGFLERWKIRSGGQ